MNPPRSSAFVCLALLWLAMSSPARGQELLTNPGFELGLTGWRTVGGERLELSSSGDAHDGQRSARVTDRTAEWNGVGQSVLGRLAAGGLHRARVFARIGGQAASATVRLTIEFNDASGNQRWVPIGNADCTPGVWTEVQGSFSVPETPVTTAFLYAEGPPAGVDLHVDAFSLVSLEDPADWRQQAEARIEQIRKRDLAIRVIDQFGRPVPGATVGVEQRRNRFIFGSTINNDPLQSSPVYRELFEELFEWATPEYEAKWPGVEPQRDVDGTWLLQRILDYTQPRGIRLRGHAVFWAVEQFVPDWAKALPDLALREEMDEHVDRYVPAYAGTFEHWDVNNEMLAGSYFEDRLGPGTRAAMFQRVRQRDPVGRLFLNEYNVVSNLQSPWAFGPDAYVQLADTLRAQGAPIDGLGVQCHFREPLSVLLVSEALDTLAATGLPILVTEYTYVADDDARAQQLDDFVTLAMAHPSVEGVVLWGFMAPWHWRETETDRAALFDADGTPRADGTRWRELRQRFRTAAVLTTDASGAAGVRAFHGSLALSIARGTDAASATVELEPGESAQDATAVLTLQRPADFSGDGRYDLFDVLLFFGAFASQSPMADFAAPAGVLNVADILTFFSLLPSG